MFGSWLPQGSNLSHLSKRQTEKNERIILAGQRGKNEDKTEPRHRKEMWKGQKKRRKGGSGPPGVAGIDFMYNLLISSGSRCHQPDMYFRWGADSYYHKLPSSDTVLFFYQSSILNGNTQFFENILTWWWGCNGHS